jgi:hypothetical protein
VREGWEKGYEGVVCCYAGSVELGDGVEVMEVCGGVVEAGRGEGCRCRGHFINRCGRGEKCGGVVVVDGLWVWV